MGELKADLGVKLECESEDVSSLEDGAEEGGLLSREYNVFDASNAASISGENDQTFSIAEGIMPNIPERDSDLSNEVFIDHAEEVYALMEDLSVSANDDRRVSKESKNETEGECSLQEPHSQKDGVVCEYLHPDSEEIMHEVLHSLDAQQNQRVVAGDNFAPLSISVEAESNVSTIFSEDFVANLVPMVDFTRSVLGGHSE